MKFPLFHDMYICSWYICQWAFPSLCGSSFHPLQEQKHLSPITLKIHDGWSRLGQLTISSGSGFCFSSPFCLVPHWSNGQHLKRASPLLQCLYMHCLIKPSRFLQSRLNRILLGAPVYSESYNSFTVLLCGSGRLGMKLLQCGPGSRALLPIKKAHRMRQKWGKKEEEGKLAKRKHGRKTSQGVKITGRASDPLEAPVG